MTTNRFTSFGDRLMWLVYLAFFLSGCSALIYQLVWQRSLFTIYGINIESITVVVTAFMVGLGLGSLMGGAISRIRGVNPLAAFGLFELGIGVYGLLSPTLFDVVGSHTLGSPPLQTFLLTFALVLLPTLLMGATLPLLVVHLVRRFHNVGVSVGILYFVNTLGAAVICFVAVVWLFGSYGKSGTLAIAATINFVVGFFALLAYWWGRRDEHPSMGVVELRHANPGVDHPPPAHLPMAFPLALVVVALIGYISLSYEILWVRVYSFFLAGAAPAFPLLLGAFLAGIAFGALLARRYCRDITDLGNPAHLRSLAYFVLFANAVGFVVVPATAYAATMTSIAFVASLAFVALGAALLGATLPLVSHFAVRPDDRAGSGLSYLYLANIVGSAAGSLVTGFVLMDHLSLKEIAVFISLLGLALSAVLFFASGLKDSTLWAGIAGAGVVALLVLASAQVLFDQTYERLLYKTKFSHETRFAHVIETKSGVITVTKDGTVFGGGVYDGHFNTDIVRDTNLIIRAYFVAAMHPAPRQVLMIGLASGSWAQVVANHPALEKLTVVEINPGYLSLLPKYPEVASLLKNPKVELVTDDGRRWLSRNPSAKFDAIIMNTSFVWRAHATNLFSVEFLEMIRSHLKPGGIVYYNTGNSPDVQRTALSVFRDAVRVYNFIAASDAPVSIDRARFAEVLKAQQIDGRPVFPIAPDEKSRDRIAAVMARAQDVGKPSPDQDPNECCFLELRESIGVRTADSREVTDDNMITEWPRIFTGEITLARIRERVSGRAVGL